VLLDRRPQVVQTVAEKLLTYAVGRGLESYDAPIIRRISRQTAAANYRWSSLVLEIVNSTPFRMRRAAS
jgi:hypothetical protein